MPSLFVDTKYFLFGGCLHAFDPCQGVWVSAWIRCDRAPFLWGVVVRFVASVFMFFAESLILAQDERWRRA